MDTHERPPEEKTKSRTRKILDVVLTVIITFVVIEAAIIIFVKLGAEPAKKFCESVAVNNDFSGLRLRAVKQGFDVRELKATTAAEQRFVITKKANEESHCLVYVRNGRVSKKDYFLYLF